MIFTGSNAAGQSPALQVAGLAAYGGRDSLRAVLESPMIFTASNAAGQSRDLNVGFGKMLKRYGDTNYSPKKVRPTLGVPSSNREMAKFE